MLCILQRLCFLSDDLSVLKEMLRLQANIFFISYVPDVLLEILY